MPSSVVYCGGLCPVGVTENNRHRDKSPRPEWSGIIVIGGPWDLVQLAQTALSQLGLDHM